MYRCLNDKLWGFCDGVSDSFDEVEMKGLDSSDEEYISGIYHICRLDPATCGRYLTHSALDARLLKGHV